MADQTPTPNPQPDTNEGLIANVVHAVEDALHSDPALAPHDPSPDPASTRVQDVPAEPAADAAPAEQVPEAQPATPVEVHEQAQAEVDYRYPESVLRNRGNIVSDGPGTVDF